MIGWPVGRVLWLLPAGCGLWWPVVGCAAMAWRLCPWWAVLCGCGLEAVALCCDRLAVCLLAACHARRPRPLLAVRLWPIARMPPPWWAVLPEGWKLAAIVGRRSCRLPVPPGGWAAPVLCFRLASCLPADLPERPAATERRTENAGKNAPKISSDFSGEVFYAHGLSLSTWQNNAPP